MSNIDFSPDPHGPVQRYELGRSSEQQRSPASATPSRPGAGKQLPEGLRTKMERSFGHDFSHVRVHEGSAAESLGAKAFAQGSQLHFKPGAYDPSSRSGQELIGHELTHVVQQSAGRVAVPQGKGAPINADAALEAEADRGGQRAAQGLDVHVNGAVRPAAGAEAAAPQKTATPSASAPIQGLWEKLKGAWRGYAGRSGGSQFARFNMWNMGLGAALGTQYGYQQINSPSAEQNPGIDWTKGGAHAFGQGIGRAYHLHRMRQQQIANRTTTMQDPVRAQNELDQQVHPMSDYHRLRSNSFDDD